MRSRRVWLLVEYLVLFFAVAGAFALVRVPGGPIPLLVVLGPAAWWYLRRRPDFDRRDLGRPEAIRPALPSILRLWLIGAVLAVVAIAVLAPDWLFNLPRQQPLIWAAVVVFRNVLSVVLTLVGGWLFARRYQRTRSLLAVSVEHALYGVLAFTVGLGALFYHGAVR